MAGSCTGRGEREKPVEDDGEEGYKVYQVGEGVADGACDERHARLEVQRLEQPEHEEQHCSTKPERERSNVWPGKTITDRPGGEKLEQERQ